MESWFSRKNKHMGRSRIPSSPTRTVYTRKGNILLRIVDELIDPYTKTWDETLIRNLFLPMDAERILRIPLSKHLDDDFLAWHKTKTFVFSVRSAYYTEWEHQFGGRVTSTEGSSNVNHVWSPVWNLQVRSKIKIYSL